MKISPRLRLHILFQNSLFVVLLIGIVAAVIFLTKDIDTTWDLTQSKRNTLSQASIDVLEQISEPISVTAFAAPDAEEDVRGAIQNFIAPFQRAKRDLSLTFIDPREDPVAAKDAGVRVNGELVITLSERTDNLRTLSEQEMVNLLLRLMRSSESLISTMDGHGEGKLEGVANFDLGDLGTQLRDKGFRISTVNFAVAQDVPHNTSVLVIAGPRVDLLPGEANRVKRYLEQGGNLLWLVDFDSLRGLDVVAEYLGLDLIDGVVIDPSASAQRLPASFSLASAYAEHPITDRLDSNTVFPYARRIESHEESEFYFTPLVQAAAGGWLETTGLRNASFDEDNDIAGPITVAAALERDVRDKRQRIVVIGTAKGLSNQYIGLLGNIDLGITTMSWLAGDDSLITIEPKTRIDLALELSRTKMAVIGFGFLIFLPLGLLISSGIIWWRRRRA
ncbi:MAG: GldG family protein [Betaproteobacteria bacterium]|jgi:ABC-type uncharacterized transport system involved in gliding motility auxiliary subunit|nr:MAG: GldG family protein [Betaproteobacteria bacterium]